MGKQGWVVLVAVVVAGLGGMTYLFGGNIYRSFKYADLGMGRTPEERKRYDEARQAPELTLEIAKTLVERYELRTQDMLVWTNPRFAPEGEPGVFVVHGGARLPIGPGEARPVEFCTTRRPDGWVVWVRHEVCNLRGAEFGG